MAFIAFFMAFFAGAGAAAAFMALLFIGMAGRKGAKRARGAEALCEGFAKEASTPYHFCTKAYFRTALGPLQARLALA